MFGDTSLEFHDLVPCLLLSLQVSQLDLALVEQSLEVVTHELTSELRNSSAERNSAGDSDGCSSQAAPAMKSIAVSLSSDIGKTPNG